MKILACLNYLRELIWPILAGKKSNYEVKISENLFKKRNVNKHSIDLAYQMYVNQKERIKRIESKSMIFIGLFGSLIALIVFLVKDLLLDNTILIKQVFLILISILGIYLFMVLKFSINALKKKSYSSFSEKDFIGLSDKEIIQNIINKVRKNYDTINEKVDSMMMAQEFAERILYIIYSFFFILLLYGIRNFLIILLNHHHIFSFLHNPVISIFIGILLLMFCYLCIIFRKVKK